MWQAIQVGAEFLLDEDDYLSEASRTMHRAAKQKVVKIESVERDLLPSPSRGRKRPRRSANTVRSYAVPGSDDESVLEEQSIQMRPDMRRNMPQETSMQLWIKHLSLLLKTETRKVTAHFDGFPFCCTKTPFYSTRQ